MRQPPTEILDVRPVVPVEAVADLRTHVAQRKGRVRRGLTPLCVGGGHLVAPVVAAAEVVVEFGAEFGGDGLVLGEDAVLAVAVPAGERGGRDVFGDPVGVAGAAVEGGDEGGGGADVRDWAREAVLEEASRVYWWDETLCRVKGSCAGEIWTGW